MVIDAQNYNQLKNMHLENSDEDLDRIRVRHPEHPKKALLSAGRAPNTDPELRVFVPLMSNAKTAGTCLPDVCIDGAPHTVPCCCCSCCCCHSVPVPQAEIGFWQGSPCWAFPPGEFKKDHGVRKGSSGLRFCRLCSLCRDKAP